MPDREKVINGVECHRKKIQTKNAVSCLECPYSEPNPIREWCMSGLMDDIYALLKEQEAVKPNLMQDAEGMWLTCGACGNKIYHLFASVVECEKPIKCQKCGKAVEW